MEVTSGIQSQINAISFDSSGLQMQIDGLDIAKTTLTVFAMIYPVQTIYTNADVLTQVQQL